MSNKNDVIKSYNSNKNERTWWSFLALTFGCLGLILSFGVLSGYIDFGMYTYYNFNNNFGSYHETITLLIFTISLFAIIFGVMALKIIAKNTSVKGKRASWFAIFAGVFCLSNSGIPHTLV